QGIGRMAMAENERIRIRRHRNAPVVVREIEAVRVVAEADLARLERLAVRTAQDRKKNLVLPPVDVEEVHVARARPVFQHAHPPRVLVARRHVVGDDVEQQSDLVPLKVVVQPGEVVFRSELRIERRRINDVVSVRASLARLEDRRSVEIADAELSKVWNDSRRIRESEAGVELHAIGRARYAIHPPRLLQRERPLVKCTPCKRSRRSSGSTRRPKTPRSSIRRSSGTRRSTLFRTTAMACRCRKARGTDESLRRAVSGDHPRPPLTQKIYCSPSARGTLMRPLP